MSIRPFSVAKAQIAAKEMELLLIKRISRCRSLQKKKA